MQSVPQMYMETEMYCLGLMQMKLLRHRAEQALFYFTQVQNLNFFPYLA